MSYDTPHVLNELSEMYTFWIEGKVINLKSQSQQTWIVWQSKIQSILFQLLL